MSDLYDPSFDYSEEEIALLREHDKGEELHEFIGVPSDNGNYDVCVECGDTSEGLMHNNTWRSVEPLWEQAEQDEHEDHRGEGRYVFGCALCPQREKD